MSFSLLEIYQNVLTSLAPDKLVREQLGRSTESGPVHVVAIGKAAVPMACAAQEVLGQRLDRGFLITKYHHLDPGSKSALETRFQLREAAHPVPDRAGLEATDELLKWLPQGRGELLVLMSGGASALLVAPNPPLGLADLQSINSALLKSGLPIERMNVLRKHLSLVKGGQLAARSSHFQRTRQLVLVDICAPGLGQEEILSLVGSGCFSPDPFTLEQAKEVLDELQLSAGVTVRAREALRETPEQVHCESILLASHLSLLEQARRRVGQALLSHPDWEPEITGEVRDVAGRFGRVALELREQGKRGVLVASGEPTVEMSVPEPGRGGRCQELALRFAKEIEGVEGVSLLAGSSDGTDGPTEDAGALVDGGTWPELCRVLGREEVERHLERHDSGTALSQLDGALLRTGPTGQNLNDLYLLQLS